MSAPVNPAAAKITPARTLRDEIALAVAAAYVSGTAAGHATDGAEYWQGAEVLAAKIGYRVADALIVERGRAPTAP